MIKTITILGGGTAGLISALMLRSTFKSLKITIVESSEYGIVGVGEGSTEHWVGFMEHCNISVHDLVKGTGATYKTGIKFQDWNGIGTCYWHSLAENIFEQDSQTGVYANLIKQIADNEDPLESVLPTALDSMHSEPFHKSFAQYHFDTNKLNTFLHKLCMERDIQIVDDIVENVTIRDGFVTHLVGKKQSYTSDFFIDSSGFRRVIDSTLQGVWIDCKKQLPMNSAYAAPSPYEENIPSHTLAKALSSGWMWRIPTQDRFGNGYVYCDDFISDDDAEIEFRNQFKHDIEIAKRIKFNAGYVDKFWNKNCVSVGLSGMFVEPLEATSIGFTIQQMFSFCSGILNWNKQNQIPAKTYNSDFKKVAENIIDFVQLHYITKRNDTEFWKWVNTGIELTDFNKENLENFKNTLPGRYNFNYNYTMFKELNWLQIMHGLGIFNIDKINKLFYDNLSHTIPFIEDVKKQQEYHTFQNVYVPHRQALNTILERETHAY